jgi:hypothetical protein
MNRQGVPTQDLGPGYFQPQQQAYGGYPAAPTQCGSNNQLYNPASVMNGYASPNSQYFPGYNGTHLGNQNMNYNNLGVPPNQPMTNNPWNRTMNVPFNPQGNTGPNNGRQMDGPFNPQGNGGQMNGPFNPQGNAGLNTGGQSFLAGSVGNSESNYVSGPQSCMAMSGERITVQPLAGTQPEGMNYEKKRQSFCCSIQSSITITLQ